MPANSRFSGFFGDPESPGPVRRNCLRRLVGAAMGGVLTVFIWLTASPTMAQVALYNSMANEAAAHASISRAEALPYTIKSGDFKLLATPSFGADWNDNVNISKTAPEGDFILRPMLQFDLSYPITQDNLLSINIGGGYDKYINHNRYSTWFLQSDTDLSFDLYVKGFWINLHDRPQYIQDASQQPELSGTATYATFNNTAGIGVTWSLNKASLSAGYDHLNVLSSTAAYDSQNRSSEMVFLRGGLQVYPAVTAGIEGSGAFTTYDQMVLNNNNNYSVGVYADWQAGKVLDIQPRVGYTTIQFQHTSQSIQTSDLNSWYADLKISHQITDSISYSLDAGHEVQAGIQSDATEDWYVRPNIRWNIFKNLGFTTSFSYEHGQQGVGNVFGNLTENYDWYSIGLSASYLLMKRLSLGLNYRLTLRSSNSSNDGYTQNVIGFLLTYQTH